MQSGKERPLICIGDKLFINKERIAITLCPALERECNQIPEATFWYGVLCGKQSVIGLELQFMTLRHRLGEQSATQSAGIGSSQVRSSSSVG